MPETNQAIDVDHIEAHISINAPGGSATELLHQETGLSKQRVKTAMTRGAVWITRGRNTRRLRRVTRPLRPGDELHLYYDAKILAETAPEPLLIADVGAYSVWHKPCGLRSQGSKWGDHCTLARWTEQHLRPQRSAFTVHRLDRAANGLMMVAHAKATAAALSSLFQKREIEKRYRALVAGDFSGHTEPLRLATPLDGKEAISEFSHGEFRADVSHSIVDVRIETGRKHQVRRHLAALGHPIIGDRLYGTGDSDGVDLQLTAYLLAFHCPVSNEQVEYRLERD